MKTTKFTRSLPVAALALALLGAVQVGTNVNAATATISTLAKTADGTNVDFLWNPGVAGKWAGFTFTTGPQPCTVSKIAAMILGTTTTMPPYGMVFDASTVTFTPAAALGGFTTTDPVTSSLSTVNFTSASPVTLAASHTYHFVLAAAGPNPEVAGSYQWARTAVGTGADIDSGSGWVLPASYVAKSFTPPPPDGSLTPWTTDTNFRLMAAVYTTTLPAIGTQPLLQAVSLGGTATFTVAATGTGTLTYQWTKNSITLANGTTVTGSTIAGAQSATLTITGAQAGDAGSYAVVVTDSLGSSPSSAALLTVDAPPTASTLAKAADATNVDFLWNPGVAGKWAGFTFTTGPQPCTVSKIAARILGTTTTMPPFGMLFDASTVTFTPAAALGGFTTTDPVTSSLSTVNFTSASPVALAASHTYYFVLTASGPNPAMPGAYQWARTAVGSGGDIASGSGWVLPTSYVAKSFTPPPPDGSLTAWTTDTNYRLMAAVYTSLSSAGAPVISTHPLSQTVAVGANVTFTVVASGAAPLSYQWTKNGSTIMNGTLTTVATAAGAQAATLTLTGVQVGDAANYAVVVGNSAGYATSNPAILTVGSTGAPPLLYGPTLSSQTALVGQNVTFAVTASGSPPLAYQWSKDSTPIPTGTNAALVLTAVQLTDAAAYSVSVSNSFGSASPGEVRLTVATAAPVNDNFASATVITGSSATVDGTNIGASFEAGEPVHSSYVEPGNNHGGHSVWWQWTAPASGACSLELTTASGSGWFDPMLAIYTGSTLNSLTRVWAGFGGRVTFFVTTGVTYRIAVDGGFGTTKAFTLALASATGTAPTIFHHPMSQGVLAGQTAAFNVGVSGTELLTYRWKKGGVDLFDGGSIAGAATSMLRIIGAQAADVGNYTVVVTNQISSATSTAATLSVGDPVISFPPQAQTANVGDHASFNVSAAGTAPLSYQWKKNGTALVDGTAVGAANISGATTTYLTLMNVQLADAGNYTVVVTNGASATVTSVPVALTVNAPVGVPAISSATSASATEGNVFNFQVTASNSPTSFAASGLPAGLTLATATGVISGTPTTVGSYPVTLTAANAGGTSASATLTITVGAAAPIILSGVTLWDSTANGTWTHDFYYNTLGLASDANTVSNVYLFTGTTSSPVYINSGNTDTSLNPNRSLTPGTYVYQFAGNNSTTTDTFVGINLFFNGDLANNRISAFVARDGANNLAVIPATTTTFGETDTSGSGLPGSGLLSYTAGGLRVTLTALSVLTRANSPDLVTAYAIGTTAGSGDFNNTNDTVGTMTLTVSVVGAVPAISSANLVAATVGLPFTFAITATNAPSAFTATNLPAGLSLNTSTGVISGTPTTAGGSSVTLTATNVDGTSPNFALTLNVSAPTAPSLAMPPLAQAVSPGTTATFTVVAEGSAPFSYQWQKNGVAIASATTATLALANAQTAANGAYSVVVTNSVSSVTSQPALLYVGAPLGVRSVAAGSDHTLFVTIDGTLWALGNNLSGELGLGGSMARATPVPVAFGVQKVVVSYGHSMFLKTDGTLWSMGHNPSGAIGDGTTVARSVPYQLAFDVTTMAAGYFHSVFVKTGGTLWAVGDNSAGQLGDGTTTDRLTPVQITGVTDVVAVSAGNWHTMWLKSNGSLWGTGANDTGQLCDGTTNNRTSPWSITTGIAAVSAGWFHTHFLKTDGTLMAAGNNEYGQLGDGTLVNRPAPVPIATGVTGVASRFSHSAFVKSNGTLWTAGFNDRSQLGDGTFVNRPAPASFTTDVASVSVGDRYTLWIKTDGSLWGVGSNGRSELGQPASVQQTTPVMLAAGATVAPTITTHPQAQTVTAGGNVTFTVVATGTAPLSYQWKKTGTALANGTAAGAATIAGATSTTLSLTGVQAGDAGDYTCYVSNSINNVTSNAAALTVNSAVPLPAITSGADATATIGTAFNFQVTASNSPTSFAATDLPGGLSIDPVTGVISGTPTMSAGYMVTLTATNAGGTGAPSILSIMVYRATATVTLTRLAATYDGTPKPVTATTSPASLPVVLTYNGSSTAPTAAGTYGVVATVSTDTYTGTASGNLVIAKADQTITFGALAAKSSTDATFALTGTASSGLAVAYTSSTPAVATVSGSTVTLVGAGTTTITASQAGNGNYNLSPTVPQTLTVTAPPAFSGINFEPAQGYALGANGSAIQAVAPAAWLYLPGGSDASIVNTSSIAGFGTQGMQMSYSGDAMANVFLDNPAAASSATFSVQVRIGNSSLPYGTDASVAFFHGATPTSNTVVASVGFDKNNGAPRILVVGAGFVSGMLSLPTASIPLAVYQVSLTVDFVSGQSTLAISRPGVGEVWSATAAVAGPEKGYVIGMGGGTNYGGDALPVYDNIVGTSTVPPTVPAITSASVATATVGSVFNFQMTASNSPTSFAATGLPAGLNLAPATGVISGTPTMAGSYPVTLTATNASGSSATSTLTITVSPAVPVPAITSTSVATATVGTVFNFQVTASNSPTSFAATDLPGGLSIDPVTGVISGTPTMSAAYAVSLTATNAGGTGAASILSITVSRAPATVTLAGLAATYDGTPKSVTATTVPAGLTVAFTYGGSSTAPTAAGTYGVVATVSTDTYTGTASGNLVIAKADQTITFGALAAKSSTDAAFALTGTASSSLPVAYVSSNLAVATVSGSTVTIVGAGTTTITASQAGNGNYNLAPTVPQTLTVTAANVAPTITTAPQSQTVTAGATVSFTVVATGNPAPSFQWMKGPLALANGIQATGSVVSGATGATLTIANTRTADAGTYDVIVSNGISPNATSMVTLTVNPATAVTITRQPVSQAANVGDSITFTVAATGSAPLSYQWKKDTVAIDGATNASLIIASVQSANVGSYTVVVSNGAGPVTSAAATLSLLAAGNSATHAVLGGGYIAGSTVTIVNTLNYTGTAASLGWEVLLPDGWSFASANGAYGDTAPLAGTTGLIGFAWSNNIAASPLSFTYTLNVPAGQTGEQQLVALVIVRPGGAAVQFLAKPDPLIVASLTRHSADTSGNSRIDLVELTRIIELYNARNGTVRTGRYKVLASSEDGFAPDPLATVNQTLTHYHSADSSGNGAISLLELTRVIELYNYRSGTVRTGEYHVHPGSEDGFNPGPLSNHPTQ